MSQLLPLFVLIPLVGLIISAFPANKQEKLLFGTAITTIGLHVVAMLVFAVLWIKEGFPDVHYQGPTLYHNNTTTFSIDLFFDRITMVYGVVSVVLTFLVSVFSRYYIHREKGFKRFFNNLLLFYLGINCIIFSGNFETLFVGWEIIGVASFFLIAFYRERYLPVKNALKVVSLYRLADIGMLLAIWMCHHAFEKSITFFELHNLQAHHVAIIEQPAFQLVIPLVFLLVAAIKSAQLPFSSWLPRAMEGPTTSSAIFYGSLSVHMGVFLLLRTYPFWENNHVFQAIVIVLGLATSIIATAISRVQSSVKTQIAYSSVAQIGIIFMEAGLGLEALALFHFACNAFLRTYQLLVSPSVLNYLMHEQFFHFTPPQHDNKDSFWGKIKLTLYVLSIKEWNLDGWMYRWLWQPLKRVGQWFQFIPTRWLTVFLLPVFAAGLFMVYHKERVPDGIEHNLPAVFGAIGLVAALRAFTERNNAQTGWFLVIVNQLFTSLSIAFNEQFGFDQIHLFLSGIIVFGAVGFACLWQLKKSGESIDLDRFHGHSYEHPRLSVVFLVASLGLSGFPVSPTFIGEDLILGHIHHNQYLLTGITTLSLILDGLGVFRMYARVFLGPHEKHYHEVAYRSS